LKILSSLTPPLVIRYRFSMLFRDDLLSLAPYTAGQSRPGAIKLSSNENPLGPSPKALEAIKEALGGLNRYPDGSARALKEKIAARWKLAPNQVVLGNGSDEVLTLIAGCTVRSGLNAVTASNTFSEYTFAARLFGGNVRKAPLKEGRFDPDAILALCDNSTRLIFICNPNNPTGTYLNHAEVERLLRFAPAETLVILDEAYAEYATAEDFPRSRELLERYDRLVVLHTFSKIFGLAGLRVGYALAHPEVASWLERVRQPFNNGNLAQVGALAALDDHEFFEESLAVNREGMASLVAFLEDKRLMYYPSQGNFVCFNCAEDATGLFERLLLDGVAVRPLNSFGLPEWIRVTVGTPHQLDKFFMAMERHY